MSDYPMTDEEWVGSIRSHVLIQIREAHPQANIILTRAFPVLASPEVSFLPSPMPGVIGYQMTFCFRPGENFLTSSGVLRVFDEHGGIIDQTGPAAEFASYVLATYEEAKHGGRIAQRAVS